MSYGVIFNGSGIDKSDLQWTSHAIERYRAVTSNPAIKPDDYILQSWNRYRSRFLPETQPGRLTSVIVQTLGMRAK